MGMCIRRKLVFVLAICLLSLLLGGCKEKEEKETMEAYVEEVQERGQTIGFHKVNAYTTEKMVRGVINSMRYVIVDVFDRNGNYLETEIAHYYTIEEKSPLISSRQTKLTIPFTIFLEDALLTDSHTITLSASEQEELQQYIITTINDKFPKKNNPINKEVLYFIFSLFILSVSLYILGFVFKPLKWHFRFAEKVISGLLITVLPYVWLKATGQYSTKNYFTILVIGYCIIAYQLVKDIKKRTREKVTQNEI